MPFSSHFIALLDLFSPSVKSMKSKKTGRLIKLHPGKRMKHGGYSFLSRGELPRNRAYIERYLTEARIGLIEHLGPTEDDLSTQQKILIDRIITKLGVVRCMEECIRESSVMQGNRLAPCLRESYLAYNNSIRLDLQALGIDKKRGDEPLDLGKYVEEKYGKKREDNGKAKAY